MASLFIWFATLGILVAIVGGVAAWVSQKSRGIRNATAFVMAGGASYCASFVVDMWAQVALGDTPLGNVVMPSITWLIFAFVLGGGAFTASTSPYAIGSPFVLNALLALAVSGVHVQD